VLVPVVEGGGGGGSGASFGDVGCGGRTAGDFRGFSQQQVVRMIVSRSGGNL